MCFCANSATSVDSLIPDIPFSPERPYLLFGSRDLQDRGSPKENAKLFAYAIEKHGWEYPDLIISGGADGGDAAAEALAVELGIPAVILAARSVTDSTRLRQREASAPWVVEQVIEPTGGPNKPKWSGFLLRNCAMAELLTQYDSSRAVGIRVNGSSGTQNMYEWVADHGVQQRVLLDA